LNTGGMSERLDDSLSRLKVLITQASIAALPGDWNALEGFNRGPIADYRAAQSLLSLCRLPAAR
jgi:hypothetical protein